MNFVNIFSTFVLTWLSLVALKPMAHRWGLLDQPGGRKTHSLPTPLVGGLGIYLGTVFICFLSPDVLFHYAALLALGGLVLAVGVMDDMKEISVSSRLGVQGGAALLMCLLADNQLNSLGNLVGSGEISLGWLALPISMFATVGVINAINMSDGLDGLSGGMVGVALSLLLLVALQSHAMLLAGFIAILLSALLGFLVLNFRLPWKRPALVYLGDAGSTFLGFVLAWLLIEATQSEAAVISPALALWFLALPLLDTVYLLLSRALEGRSPFAPGRDHLHHRLLARGFSAQQTVCLLVALGGSLGLSALLAQAMGANESQLFFGFLALFAVYAALSRRGRSSLRGSRI